jgi:5-methyltetrahydropteroyltriglutamate--homocysteine methyltransferase
MIASSLGFPRIGPKRELKQATESFWSGKITEEELQAAARTRRKDNWAVQKQRGLDHIPSNDFSLYDHVLDTIAMVGAVPARYGWSGKKVDLATYFAMARGAKNQPAMEMTKWFDTNYHYIVPEFEDRMQFSLASTKAVDEFLEAKAMGIITRPVLVGPLSLLLLGKMKESTLQLPQWLDRLLPVYEQVLQQLYAAGAPWVQIDEPCLVLDLPKEVAQAYPGAYARLAQAAPGLQILVATYFEGLGEHLDMALNLPVAGLHLDLVRAPHQLTQALATIPAHKILSLGVIDGRNIWRTNLTHALGLVTKAVEALGQDRVFVAPSCSLLHVPVDLKSESQLDAELTSWLAFAHQKIEDVVVLANAVSRGAADPEVKAALTANQAAVASRSSSARIHNQAVKKKVNPSEICQRNSPYETRRAAQEAALHLPLFPTTTIGSFPQTKEVRAKRAAFKAGQLSQADYDAFLYEETTRAIRFQEEMGIDLLVHGEFERNDMVEYFGEQLDGFAFTQNGWVQSYGSRCVKPPVLYGDVSRPTPMTVAWSRYAQSQTKKPVKGMLTGPVTILKWSFVRDDQPLSLTCHQIAYAIGEEVRDLEAAGIRAIQIDEPALREGLPLKRSDWKAYLAWAVAAFKRATALVNDATQIHTHMCYAEFNDIIEAIGEMDADVISIETSRSQMELLSAFTEYKYPNEIGPGVYDIHSPRVPDRGEMERLLEKAKTVLSARQLWVNPDCGLKTRQWDEVKPALQNMVDAAQTLRKQVTH